MSDTSQYYIIEGPGTWYLVDGATAEPEVNWPGELVSEYPTKEEAEAALKKAQQI
jgi:hypothetical protein